MTMQDGLVRISRRSLTASGAGFAIGLLGRRVGAVAHEATPEAADATPSGGLTPLGYASIRLRKLTAPEHRAEVNALVIEQFVPEVVALHGFEGYLVGDVIDQPEWSLSVLVLDHADDEAAFGELAQAFVGSIAEMVDASATRQWAGDLYMTAAPAPSAATPAATPLPGMAAGYAALRIHTSLPNTNPLDFVPEAIAGFLPIVTALPGFLGYLWFPIDTGFVALSLYDTEASAQASTVAAKDWAAEHLKDYTDGNPEVINASVVYAELPIFE